MSLHAKQLSLLVLLALLVFNVVSYSHAAVQSSQLIPSRGRIEVTGEYGNAPLGRLVGWNLKGMNWQVEPQSWESPSVIAKIRSYGANGIRRHFRADWWYGSSKSTYVKRFHNVANWCADNGMWVIFDLYELGGLSNDPQSGTYDIWKVPEPEFVDMWTMIAAELKDHGNVLLELGNEPDDKPEDSSHRDKWFDLCKAAIPAMRDVGFTGYIVIPLPECCTYGQIALDRFDELLAVDPLKRLMIDFHHYWYWHLRGKTVDTSDIRSWLSSRKISQLRERGYRVLCGEFGVEDADDSRDLTWFKNLVEILVEDGYDMMGEQYGNGFMPQVTGSSMSSLINNPPLNTVGKAYVNRFPSDITYYS